jgi:hypothetical protein
MYMYGKLVLHGCRTYAVDKLNLVMGPRSNRGTSSPFRRHPPILASQEYAGTQRVKQVWMKCMMSDPVSDPVQ